MSKLKIKIKVEHEMDGVRVVCDQCGLGEEYDPWKDIAQSERWMTIYRSSRSAHAGPALDFCSWTCVTNYVRNHQGNPFEEAASDE